jgi:hypothetical protein
VAETCEPGEERFGGRESRWVPVHGQGLLPRGIAFALRSRDYFQQPLL